MTPTMAPVSLQVRLPTHETISIEAEGTESIADLKARVGLLAGGLCDDSFTLCFDGTELEGDTQVASHPFEDQSELLVLVPETESEFNKKLTTFEDRLETAESLFSSTSQESAETRKQAEYTRDGTIAEVHYEIGELYRLESWEHENWEAYYDKALQHFKTALKLWEGRDDQQDASHISLSHWSMGGVYYNKDDYDSAATHFRKAIDIAKESSSNRYKLAPMLNNLGEALPEGSNMALKCFEEAIQTEERNFCVNASLHSYEDYYSVALAQFKMNAGRCHQTRGDYTANPRF
eukprot:TRINITY_DN3172_c3_g1_i2.p1 TRINITY_DN3172_c3_g1~~TRINITY_DN3172_c3_g1_i2.p1  ORF type:complete len:292 (+),score=60.09 TRINITY_DN3172_c3_g1_i2:191-1066(+)